VDPTTREANPPSPTSVPPPDRTPPAALWLVRWALVLHCGLWVLVTLAHAVALAAGTAAPSAWTWTRLVASFGMAAGTALVSYRIGRGRPAAWLAAIVLQVLAAAGYGELTLSLVAGSGQLLAPDLVTWLVGLPLVLVSIAGAVLTAGPDLRGYCIRSVR
jgi:hypothetical protein